jgi:putative transposase
MGPGSILLPGYQQHVIMRAIAVELCFIQSRIISIIWRSWRQHKCLIHACVLMANHIHLLVTPEHENSI